VFSSRHAHVVTHGSCPAVSSQPRAGEYGLRNKREVWRVKFTLAKIRKAARELLTLDEKDPRRLFEGVYEPIFEGVVVAECFRAWEM
jgi:hypothetical protein